MIEINLLPKNERRIRRNVPIGTFIIIVATVSILALMLIYYMANLKRLNDLNERYKQVKVEKRRYAKYEGQYKKIKAELELINKKLSVLNRLDNGRTFGPKLLEMLLIKVPENMWFNSLSLKNDTLIISGSSLNRIAVSDFADFLVKSDLIDSSTIKKIEQKEEKVGDKKIDVTTFSIECKINSKYRASKGRR